MFDVVLPVPGSPSCCPSLSFALLLVQMQQKSIIIFSLLKFSLAELKMNLLSEMRQPQKNSPRCSLGFNFSAREFRLQRSNKCRGHRGHSLSSPAGRAAVSQHCLPHVMAMPAWEFRAARIPFHSLDLCLMNFDSFCSLQISLEARVCRVSAL